MGAEMGGGGVCGELVKALVVEEVAARLDLQGVKLMI